MPRSSAVHAVTTLGIDMGKNTLHMIGLDTTRRHCVAERRSHAGALHRGSRICLPVLSVSKRGWRLTTLLGSLPRWATT